MKNLLAVSSLAIGLNFNPTHAEPVFKGMNSSIANSIGFIMEAGAMCPDQVDGSISSSDAKRVIAAHDLLIKLEFDSHFDYTDAYDVSNANYMHHGEKEAQKSVAAHGCEATLADTKEILADDLIALAALPMFAN